MYAIHVDHQRAIVSLSLKGVIQMPEMAAFCAELRVATAGLKGRPIKIHADVRHFRPVAQDVADLLRQVQEFGIQSGVTRVAEMVGSEIIALQLNRVARESGTDRILRRFHDEDQAQAWLSEAA